MTGSGEVGSRAVASAVRGAVVQARLEAGVNMAGLLVDFDMAIDADFRQFFMCWHLTRVLGPSLTEIVPPSIVQSVLSYRKSAPSSAKSDLTKDAAVRDSGGVDAPAGDRRSDHVLCASGHRTCWCPEDTWIAFRDGGGESGTSP